MRKLCLLCSISLIRLSSPRIKLSPAVSKKALITSGLVAGKLLGEMASTNCLMMKFNLRNSITLKSSLGNSAIIESIHLE